MKMLVGFALVERRLEDAGHVLGTRGSPDRRHGPDLGDRPGDRQHGRTAETITRSNGILDIGTF